MKNGEIIIHLIVPHEIPGAECFLTDSESQHAARFRFDEDRARWSACRAALRQIIGEEIGLPPLQVPLIFSTHGKPLLAAPHDGLHFNLTHCPDLALLALSRSGPVGIDLESKARAAELPECMEAFCHPAEIAELPSGEFDKATRLLEIWTAKEAFLKALGTGLSHPPESVRILFQSQTATSDLALPGLENQRLHLLQHPFLSSHVAMLSTSSGIDGSALIFRLNPA